MRAVLLNRILLVLSFIGLFVAGALSLEKILDISLPCGDKTGCDIVAADPSSSLFGMPVAYIGFLGYVLFAGLAIARAMKAPYDTKLVTVGLGASMFGAAFSVYLQYLSFFHIHAVCPYCLTSAITMIATAVCYVLLYQAHKVAPAPAMELTKLDLWVIAGLPFVLLVVWVGLMSSAKSRGGAIDAGRIEYNEQSLVPENPNLFGARDAAITIVEFADMCCPSCQKTSPKVKDFASQNPKTVRIIYREFPLSMHKLGKVAAAMGEYAAEKGRFWDFTIAVMALNRQPESVDELLSIAKSLGLDPDDIQNRLSNPKDPVFERVTRDMNLAHKLGISATPTFIILAKGIKATSCGPNDVLDKLNGPDYRAILLGHA